MPRSNHQHSSNKPVKLTPARLIVSIVIVLVAAYFGIDLTGTPDSQTNNQPASPTPQATQSPSSTGSLEQSQRELVALIDAQRSGQMVECSARVVKILEDDQDGARHQRFLLAIERGSGSGSDTGSDTVLVAHNIDLAPRVPFQAGDTVTIFGQYEWNDRGGVLHWTHHDPGGRHAEGWIEHNGTRYD
tara:strand:- start:19748 stop:20311 length:564 start_codon:yes stop_codon:yes gene_type:complete